MNFLYMYIPSCTVHVHVHIHVLNVVLICYRLQLSQCSYFSFEDSCIHIHMYPGKKESVLELLLREGLHPTDYKLHDEPVVLEPLVRHGHQVFQDSSTVSPIKKICNGLSKRTDDRQLCDVGSVACIAAERDDRLSVLTAAHLFVKDYGYYVDADSNMYCQDIYDDKKYAWLSDLSFGLHYRDEFKKSAPVDVAAIVLPPGSKFRNIMLHTIQTDDREVEKAVLESGPSVVKFGARTRLTQGRVVNPCISWVDPYSGVTIDGFFAVKPEDPSYFAFKGDSGALVW